MSGFYIIFHNSSKVTVKNYHRKQFTLGSPPHMGRSARKAEDHWDRHSNVCGDLRRLAVLKEAHSGASPSHTGAVEDN